MQHFPSAPATSERPQRDRATEMVYILLVLLLLVLIGLIIWSEVPGTTARDTAYVNPELRLVERFRSQSALSTNLPAAAALLAPPDLATNPELKFLNSYRVGLQPAQDFDHANPEVGLFQRLQSLNR